jgi:lysozyme
MAMRRHQAIRGCRLAAYRDPGGILTIGYGHTGPEVVPGLRWTQDQADDELRFDVTDRAEKPVNGLVRYELDENQNYPS